MNLGTFPPTQFMSGIKRQGPNFFVPINSQMYWHLISKKFGGLRKIGKLTISYQKQIYYFYLLICVYFYG